MQGCDNCGGASSCVDRVRPSRCMADGTRPSQHRITTSRFLGEMQNMTANRTMVHPLLLDMARAAGAFLFAFAATPACTSNVCASGDALLAA
jgi:hypothetical protein